MTSLQTATLDELRQAAARICRDYLTGKWKTVTPEQLVVRRVSGGLSNFLYYISLPEDNGAAENSASLITVDNTVPSVEGLNNENSNITDILYETLENSSSFMSAQFKQQEIKEPREVLLRIYGQSHGEDALEAMITESVVFALLSERNFGPKLHGIFPGGRVEQYIPARPLLTSELSNTNISKKIAEKMAEIHSLNIPMSKEPDWLWNCMDRWLKNISTILEKNDWSDAVAEQVKFIRSIDFYEEIKWLKSVIEQGNYIVMFCHNDLQEGNILLREEQAGHKKTIDDNCLTYADSCACSRSDSSSEQTVPDLIIIDFEYCAYNYRGFDLANHFLEWTFDYSNPEFPHYYHRKEQYPTKQQRRDFIKVYLKKLLEQQNNSEPTFSNAALKEIRNEDVKLVENEIRVFSMFSHLFWSLWSVVNVTSNIEFGYWQYAVTRIHEFQVLKNEFLSKTRSSV